MFYMAIKTLLSDGQGETNLQRVRKVKAFSYIRRVGFNWIYNKWMNLRKV